MIKILIQHRHRSDEISGVLTYVQILMSELQAKGHEVKLTSMAEDSLKDWISAILWADVVHMNSNHAIFAILCKILGKKIIIKYHYPFYASTHYNYQKMSFLIRLKTEMYQLLPQKNYPMKWKLYTAVKYARLITRLMTAFLVDRHTACSQFLAESYSLPQSIIPLSNPIQFKNMIQPQKLTDLKQPYQFVFVGRLQPDKGVDILLKAVQNLKAENYAFQVCIIGEGHAMSDLKKLAKDLEILDQVKFFGKLPNEQVKSILKSALALVAPSRWHDPAPYVTLEAASVQTCSIVSQMGGLPEMVGTHGLLFENENIEELANCMKTCLEHPEDAINRGRKAYQYITQKFSPETAADEFMQLCHQIKPTLAQS